MMALEFTILTAARTGEVLSARWGEIDFGARIWTVPASRMKGRREHRVPLSSRAVELLEALEAHRTGARIFPVGNAALTMTMRRMGVETTVHGFRSSFRDWAGDETHFPREVAEAALAHSLGDKTEAAYRRSDALAKRRELMQAWANYLTSYHQSYIPRGG
jgi:integrase